MDSNSNPITPLEQGKLRPQIDYRHVLRELSVNRRDPCEVIRELISNAYDAGAANIEIVSLSGLRGFIFFDDGTGLCQDEMINGITPYEAFFSVGKSTKVPGQCIGYKCQGSKLCFAAERFFLVTKCSTESAWRQKLIDNPRLNLTAEFDLTPSSSGSPWTGWASMFHQPDARLASILDHYGEAFFRDRFDHGTMIVATGLQLDGFDKYYRTDHGSKSYLWNYIRFHTRHGDVRNLRPEKTGFPAAPALALSSHPGYNAKTNLRVWVDSGFQVIPAGYPYLEWDDRAEATTPLIKYRASETAGSSQGAQSHSATTASPTD